MLTEADTCRKYVLPKLYTAGWTDDQISGHSAETAAALELLHRASCGTQTIREAAQVPGVDVTAAPRLSAARASRARKLTRAAGSPKYVVQVSR